MDRNVIKIGMVVLLSGRRAEVKKIKGQSAKVSPFGESSRWVKIVDLVLCEE